MDDEKERQQLIALDFILIEEIPAPRGAPRYRIVAQGVTDAGPAGVQKTVDTLELARGWADEIAGTWRSQPPLYLRHPLGSGENEIPPSRA